MMTQQWLIDVRPFNLLFKKTRKLFVFLLNFLTYYILRGISKPSNIAILNIK